MITTSTTTWRRATLAKLGQLATSASSSHFPGAQSLQTSGQNSGVLQQFAVTPGASYTLSAYAMVPAGSPLTGSESGFMQLIFYDAAKNQISPYAPPNAITVL